MTSKDVLREHLEWEAKELCKIEEICEEALSIFNMYEIKTLGMLLGATRGLLETDNLIERYPKLSVTFEVLEQILPKALIEFYRRYDQEWPGMGAYVRDELDE